MRLACLLLLLSGAAVPASAAFQVTVVPAAQWGASDAELGLDGGHVEDFEDVNLAAGLLVAVSGPDGRFTAPGDGVLPTTFDPVADDAYGDAFVPGIWDGQRGLLSTEGNVALDYGSQDFRRLRFEVPGGAAWIGFSLQQLTGNEPLLVNGASLGRVQALGVPLTAGRNGYLVIASDDPAEPVTSVVLGGAGDAFLVDHVVFAPGGSVPAAGRTWSTMKALFR